MGRDSSEDSEYIVKENKKQKKRQKQKLNPIDNLDDDFIGDEKDQQFLDTLKDVDYCIEIEKRRENRKKKQDEQKYRDQLKQKNIENLSKNKRHQNRRGSSYSSSRSSSSHSSYRSNDDSSDDEDNKRKSHMSKRQNEQQQQEQEELFAYLKKITLNREQLEKLIKTPYFAEQVKGMFVRARSDQGQTSDKNMETYIFSQIKSVDQGPKTYQLQNNTQTNQSLIDRYKFGNAIGKGSYAIVRLGTDTQTGQNVAIKTYDKFKLIDQQKRTNLRRETQILKFIDHPNVIKLYDTIDTRTNVSLVMEYIGQLTLRQFIKDSSEKRIREPEAIIIFSQVVHAISYLHQNNINHRDIKLENIMINPTNLDIRIIDFGFAIRSDKKLNIFCGTPSYMAPEIVKKQEYYGRPSDVWALGILLFAMLFGKFPFKGKDDHDLYRKIQKQEVSIPQGISVRAQSLLTKIFQKTPDQRPDCQQILRDDWFKN